MTIPTECPKCQKERKPGEDACARCGLLVARFELYRDELPELPAIDEAWAALAGRWEDDEAHRRFLETAAACDGLDLAAGHYRKVRAERPDDARAEAGLERAVELAVNLYIGRTLAARAEGTSRLLKLAGLAGGAAVVLAALLLLYAVLRPAL